MLSDQHRLDAVRQVVEGNRKISAVAAGYCISESALYVWVRAYRHQMNLEKQDEAIGASPSSPNGDEALTAKQQLKAVRQLLHTNTSLLEVAGFIRLKRS